MWVKAALCIWVASSPRLQAVSCCESEGAPCVGRNRSRTGLPLCKVAKYRQRDAKGERQYRWEFTVKLSLFCWLPLASRRLPTRSRSSSATTETTSIVGISKEGEITMRDLRWGLVPYWRSGDRELVDTPAYQATRRHAGVAERYR
jgi:hypothetical protein